MRKKEIDWFYQGGAAAIYPDGEFHIIFFLALLNKQYESAVTINSHYLMISLFILNYYYCNAFADKKSHDTVNA